MSSLAARACEQDNSAMQPQTQRLAAVTVTELPLRPQDELECRRCEVRCDKVVYPSACVERACPFLYAYEEFVHTYIGGMHRVEVEECYDAGRSGELGCVNPEFHELPVGRPTFKVFAHLAD